MIVVTIIGILATIAVPIYRTYVQQAHLAEAKPYLLDIASKERSYKVRNGLYCCASSNLSEANLTSGLNVDLNGTGNFCFVVICRDSTLCTTTNSTNFISTSQGGDPTRGVRGLGDPARHQHHQCDRAVQHHLHHARGQAHTDRLGAVGQFWPDGARRPGGGLPLSAAAQPP